MSGDDGFLIDGAGLQDRALVRLGDTVRRPTGHWRESVHDLLRHLRRQGLDIIPEPLGVDEEGREILRFLPGRDQGWPFIPDILTDTGAEELGRLTTCIREALRTYGCPPDARWQSRTGAPAEGEAMQHGDLGPWNLLWGDSPAVSGVLDWDFAEPGDAWYDTGFLAWFTVPFMDDERAHSRGFPSPPDRSARLSAFARGAGLEREQVLRFGLAAQREFADRVRTRAERNLGPWPSFYAMGMHTAALSDMEWTRGHTGTS